MKKHLFIRALSLLAFLFLAQSLPAQTAFEEEVHYFSIIPEQPGAEGNRVQVLEFFWYACPHCFKLEPHINAWLDRKPDNVEFVRIPAMFKRADVVLHAKTFYALTLMGVEDELNGAIFDEIHTRGNKLATAAAMDAFLADRGVDMDAYHKAMKSFAVQTQARRAEVLASRFDIRGVPAFVVDGKYRTSGLEGDLQMQAIDYLTDKVITEKRVKTK
jgi:thiol:disulfide interchange protein DsbA